MSLWVHVLGSVTTIDKRGVMHAATDGAQLERLNKRGRARHGWTWPTVCGRKRTMAVGQKVRDSEGREGAMTLVWPPALRDLAEGQLRCQECYVQTGKPRPAWPKEKRDGVFVGADRGAA